MTAIVRKLKTYAVALAWLMTMIFSGMGWGRESTQWQQPLPAQCPNLYCWKDTCNVYVLKKGDSAILIDLGDGSVLSHLEEIGITKLDWILFTHHHREQCQGFAMLNDRSVKTAAPAEEQMLFEQPASFRKAKPSLDDPFTVYGASYVRPPVVPIPINKPLQAEEVFSWRDYRLHCMGTPGNSPGSMTFLLETNGRTLAFSGDVMLDGAHMHTWFDSEWDYGFGKGLETLIGSVNQLITKAPDIMLPSHGPLITDPKRQLAEYARKLRELQKRYVRGYPVLHVKDEQRDPISRPTAVPEIFQVTPHLYKFNRPGEGSNFSIIVADSGRAIISDCGLMSAEFLDRALAGMRQHLGLRQIDAMVISHMHGDHFLLGEHLRNKYGAKIWTLDCIADKCEHPERYDYAAMIESYNSGVDRLGIDRRLRDGEVIEWEGYHLQVDWMPGQTEFGCCLWLELDGRRIAFTGDNIFGDPSDPNQDGHEAVVARNSAIFEQGYLYAANYLKKLQPDLLMGGHSFVMPEPKAFIERYYQWAQEIIHIYQGLLPGPDYRYRFDPYWVRAEPYRVTLEPGESVEVQVVVRNFHERDQHHHIDICTPLGITAQPPALEGIVGGTSSQSFPVRFSATPGARPGMNIAAFDITLDGKRYGQWFDMIVEIGTAR
jgi:glyoxylase-like metal-dependent hydrolase (beta-lactamase superfamily II)